MATWSKIKQQLEGYLAEGLIKRVEYSAGSYRYTPERSGQSYIKVDKSEVFKLGNSGTGITWYKTEQEVRKGQEIDVLIREDEIEEFQKNNPNIPKERIQVILLGQKQTTCAKQIIAAQDNLVRSDFGKLATQYLSSSIEKCLESEEILLNVFALMDRRVGKSRLRKIKMQMTQKHPVVQYFYQLRCAVECI